MDERFVPLLREMTQKYTPAGSVQAQPAPGEIALQGAQGAWRFYYDFTLPDAPDRLPLLHWRAKRRYVELRNILLQKLVEHPLAVRIHHIVPRDAFAASLQDVFVQETDLVEFITGQPVTKVFADFCAGEYVNCILCTAGGVRVSMELGFSPAGSQPVLLHEVIGKTGIASDVAVDTQTQQYPVYVFKGPDTATYTDVDAELYGLENTQADCVRFLVWFLQNADGEQGGLRRQARHLQAVWQAARYSGENAVYATVEV